ncbi:MAG: hypothetical protein AAFU77_09460 [Myxococcota bacterium]
MKHSVGLLLTSSVFVACGAGEVEVSPPGVQDLVPRSTLSDEIDTGDDGSSDENGSDRDVPGTDAGDGGAVSGPSEEVCDGFDNDRDGEIDEGMGGAPCGDGGTLRCIAGNEICNECTAGETRQGDCPCGVERTDLCNDVGRWVEGSCGGCDETPISCLDAGACVPGTTRIRRCDSCTGPDCGATCVGAEFVCTDTCEWEQVGACEAMNPSCDRDLTLFEPCGRCGTERLECDGCFWASEGCSDQGICTPGDTRATACGTDQCGDGLAADETCSDTCEWQRPDSCDGCIIGEIRIEREPCAAGAPGCGERVVQLECVEASSSTSCDGSTIRVGTWMENMISDCDVQCLPGETRSANCRAAGDTCGSYGQGCTDRCQWSNAGPGQDDNGVCEERPDACTPGEVRGTREVSCGANRCGATYTIEEECRANGCGFATNQTSCPACVAGDTDRRRCTTSDGRCGNRSRTCSTNTCEWGDFGACIPSDESCVEGTTRTEPCTAQCGESGRRTLRCNGCGWDVVGECEPVDPGVCEPGEVVDLGVCPLCPTQRRERRCSTSCEWVETSCGVCG